MRSRHADTFNHDEEAPGYDRDVLDERDPIRAGYDALLAWVSEKGGLGPESSAVELGSGTGNLTLRLPPMRTLVCVDVSSEMTAIAREKLREREGVQFVQEDLLAFFDAPRPRVDAVLSTYAIHHLTASEREKLFRGVAGLLRPGGRLIVGDLMFEDPEARAEILGSYRRSGRGELADDIEEEFFWDLARDGASLERLGFRLETKRFSELSFGVVATLLPGE